MTRGQLLWIVAFPLEAASAWLVFAGSTPPGLAAGVGLHVVASGLFGAALLKREAGKWQLAWPLLGTTLALFAFPVMGMAAIAVAYVVGHLLRWRETLSLTTQPASEDAPAEDAVARAHEVEVGLLDE